MNSKADLELVKGIMQGNLASVAGALDAGADIEAPDVHGFSGFPLRVACSQGHSKIVLELLRRGAQINAASRDGPGGALRLARRSNRAEIVGILLRHGADPLADQPDVARKNTLALDPPSLPADAPAPAATAPERTRYDTEVEHLLITGCYGVDTSVLDGDLLRLSESDPGFDRNRADDAARREAGGESENRSKFKFWKR
ncbi:MAG: hypothetical protein HY777_04985 [Betaproteobacteria bacterium]|nr:hypothetical protein [Betaproteobacteria bacterium]